MKVLIYSEKEADYNPDIGWQRGGEDISYYQNNIKRENTGRSRYYYSLSFNYEFKHSNDAVYFAYCYPYTYSDLGRELGLLQRDRKKAQYITQTTLCRTLAGNNCHLLTITGKGTEE
jgi:hypothetical protein